MDAYSEAVPAAHQHFPEPKTERGRATCNRIVESATALMAERGIAAVSLDDVRAASGASKSQLYHYFADKDHLVATVIARRTQEIVELYDEQLGEIQNLADLDAFFDRVLADHRAVDFTMGCPIASLAGELAARTPESTAEISEAFSSIDAAMSAAMTRLADGGELPPGSAPDELATSVFALIEGGLLLAKNRASGTPLEIALNAARQLVGLPTRSLAA